MAILLYLTRSVSLVLPWHVHQSGSRQAGTHRNAFNLGGFGGLFGAEEEEKLETWPRLT